MYRFDFLAGLLTSGAAALVPASPAPQPADPLDQCDDNPALRYDQRIEFKQRALDAPDVDLKDYLGKIVLLNFFATWCGPCKAEQPDLQDLYTKYYDAGFRVIGLNYGETDNTVRRYRDGFHISYPIVMEAETILHRVQTNSVSNQNIVFPVSLFLWDNGLLSCYRRGAMGRTELVHKIEGMLKAMHEGT
ncbi:MAG TPA: TlpA disulfide reductase family protein [Candidatus Baltobacteraceae bacterium]|nr:TlpA disulfide reductase family protein [Candidatus Baltobacteraceae bacterium]